MSERRSTLFQGRHFGDEIIVLCLRWYLRYPLSYSNLKEVMAERGLQLDHSTIARWVLRYAGELNERICSQMRRPGRSWRVDETYVRVAGQWNYLAIYTERSIRRAARLTFRFRRNRDLTAAKSFLQLALWGADGCWPRVINVDGHPAYPMAMEELKASGDPSPTCKYRRSPYLNNIIEQDHRFVKKRITASQGFRSFDGAMNAIAGYEAMNIIRKGQIRWLPKSDIVGQAKFIEQIFGMAA